MKLLNIIFKGGLKLMIKIQNIKRSKKVEISFELVDDKNETSVPLAQVVLSDRIKSDFIIKLRSLITSIITYDGIGMILSIMLMCVLEQREHMTESKQIILE